MKPEQLREEFELFFVEAFAHMLPGTELLFEPYIRHICDVYQNLGKRSSVIVNLPPRCLKTIITIAFAAWYLGRHSGKDIMIVSNKQDLAELIIKRLRDIIESGWYKKIFPKTTIEKGHSNASRFATTRKGSVVAASIEGSIAGYGADLMILDDPNKIQDAGRPDRLEAVNAKFDGELYSRINNKKQSITIVVQHRLDANDLSGHLIARGGFKRIAFPLIAPSDKRIRLSTGQIWARKKDDLLVPNYSRKDVEYVKKQMTPDFFWFYQQGIGQKPKRKIRIEDFVLRESKKSDGPFVISVDTAQGDGPNGSFNVIQIWQKLPATYHLFFQFRERCGFANLQLMAKSLVKHFRPAAVLIETAANGAALLSILKTQLPEFVFEGIHPHESKAERLHRHLKDIQGGKLSLQKSEPWIGDFLLEFSEFPDRGTDIVDATTQMLDFARNNPIWEAPLPPPPAVAGVGSNGRPLTFSGSISSRHPGIARASFRSILRR